MRYMSGSASRATCRFFRTATSIGGGSGVPLDACPRILHHLMQDFGTDPMAEPAVLTDDAQVVPFLRAMELDRDALIAVQALNDLHDFQ